jgi:hypothetical protein
MPSSPKWPLLLCAGALACGGIAGYVVNHGDRPSAELRASTVPAGDAPTAETGKQLEQALFEALQAEYSLRASYDLYEALSRMSPEQISSVAARLQLLPEEKRASLTRKLIAGWSEFDSGAARQYAFALDPGQREEAIMAGLSGWARTKPQAAQAWVLALPPGPVRISAIHQLVNSLASNNPAAALRFVKAQPGSPSDFYNRIFGVLAEQNPAAAGAEALALPEGENRHLAIYAVVRTWAPKEPAAALAWTAQIPQAGVRSENRGVVYTRWARKDPLGAKAMAQALPDGDERDHAISNIISAVSAANPPDGAELAMLLPAGPARTRAMRIVASEWAGTDLRTTLDWIAQIADDKIRAEVVQSAMPKGLESDPRVFVDYLLQGKQLPERGYQSVIATCASIWASRDVDAALEWARQIEDEKVRGEVMSAVISAMSVRDPVRAASLLGEVPARWRSSAVGNVTRNWFNKDKPAARRWLTQTTLLDEKAKEGFLRNATF